MSPTPAPVQRIMVIGSSGTGKSTVARRLGEMLGLPVIHLDAEFWRPGWVEPERAIWHQQVAALAARDAWIMDGQYSATWDLRVNRADTIIWLDLPRRIYMTRIIKRTLLNYGRVRGDLGPGCPERFDWPFLKFVWNYPHRSRSNVMVLLEREARVRRVVILRSEREVATFLGHPHTALGATAGHVPGKAGAA
jgi:adenylate kinase family enzyme